MRKYHLNPPLSKNDLILRHFLGLLGGMAGASDTFSAKQSLEPVRFCSKGQTAQGKSIPLSLQANQSFNLFSRAYSRVLDKCIFILLDQGSTKYDPWAKSTLPPVVVSKILLEHSLVPFL